VGTAIDFYLIRKDGMKQQPYLDLEPIAEARNQGVPLGYIHPYPTTPSLYLMNLV
jgi:hypothetical protein